MLIFIIITIISLLFTIIIYNRRTKSPKNLDPSKGNDSLHLSFHTLLLMILIVTLFILTYHESFWKLNSDDTFYCFYDVYLEHFNLVKKLLVFYKDGKDVQESVVIVVYLLFFLFLFYIYF